MILERFKQKRQDSNSTSQEDQSSQPPVTRAIITSEYLAGETNGQEFARIAWPKITMVTLKIEADENGDCLTEPLRDRYQHTIAPDAGDLIVRLGHVLNLQNHAD